MLGREPLAGAGFSGILEVPNAADCLLLVIGVLGRDAEDAVGFAKLGVLEIPAAELGLLPTGAETFVEDVSFRATGVLTPGVPNGVLFLLVGMEIGAGFLRILPRPRDEPLELD